MRALFLIDGEHYPPVVLDAMQSVEQSLDAEGVAAAFLGGTEKIRDGTDYGVPLVEGKDPVSAVQKALSEYEVDVVVDLSDEPVIGYRERMKIASLALYAGARYLGSDFELKPPDLRPVSTKPSLAVIGTGKRVGKTAISGYLARLLAREGFDPGVVSMGRGGPQLARGHRGPQDGGGQRVPARGARARGARRERLLRDGGPEQGHHRRMPQVRRRSRRRTLRLQRPGGGRDRQRPRHPRYPLRRLGGGHAPGPGREARARRRGQPGPRVHSRVSRYLPPAPLRPGPPHHERGADGRRREGPLVSSRRSARCVPIWS